MSQTAGAEALTAYLHLVIEKGANFYRAIPRVRDPSASAQ